MADEMVQGRYARQRKDNTEQRNAGSVRWFKKEKA
jgi:hypothetical protein